MVVLHVQYTTEMSYEQIRREDKSANENATKLALKKVYFTASLYHSKTSALTV